MAEFSESKIFENVFAVEKNCQGLNWQAINPGVDICYLYKDEASGAAAAYIRYAPGTSVKQHQHLGYEHIIVLQGEQNDESHIYPQGCLAIQPPATSHTIASQSGCTVLAIWTGPLKFKL